MKIRSLDQAIADIRSAPGGPTVGAFFDFDGTLAAGFTGAVLPLDRLRRGEMGTAELLTTVWVAINYALGRFDFAEFIRRGSLTLRGRHTDELAEIGERLYTKNIAARIYPEMKELVAAHLERGHMVALSTAAFHVQLAPAARALGIENLLCNRFEIDESGFLTGEVRKPILRGRTKADAVMAFADGQGVDLARSYFYADGDEEISLMVAVGNPRPTNPAKRLARVADENHWPILRFTSRSGNLPVAHARTLVGTLAALPLAAVAAVAALLRLNRQCGYELFASYWPTRQLKIARVGLRVTGMANMYRSRRAVYLINHRSAADAAIMGALLRSEWAALSPSLSADAVTSTMRKLLRLPECTFDPADVGHRPIVAAAEGAIGNSAAIGAFDTYPFRLARKWGMPVVPVVIRNADTITPPGEFVLHPGTVDIAVLEPVSVDGRTEAQLAAEVAAVRQRFIDTLDSWSGPPGPPDHEITKSHGRVNLITCRCGRAECCCGISAQSSTARILKRPARLSAGKESR